MPVSGRTRPPQSRKSLSLETSRGVCLFGDPSTLPGPLNHVRFVSILLLLEGDVFVIVNVLVLVMAFGFLDF